MDYTVHQYRFRLEYRGRTVEVGGRSLENEDGQFNLQTRLSSPQQNKILLEVQFCDDEERIWPLFWRVCQHRGVLPIAYKRQKLNGGWTEWEMIPMRPEDFQLVPRPIPEDPKRLPDDA
ncbi:MAG: hypothetical protein ACE366_08365 [Bradymonadia bacterium]